MEVDQAEDSYGGSVIGTNDDDEMSDEEREVSFKDSSFMDDSQIDDDNSSESE